MLLYCSVIVFHFCRCPFDLGKHCLSLIHSLRNTSPMCRYFPLSRYTVTLKTFDWSASVQHWLWYVMISIRRNLLSVLNLYTTLSTASSCTRLLSRFCELKHDSDRILKWINKCYYKLWRVTVLLHLHSYIITMKHFFINSHTITSMHAVVSQSIKMRCPCEGKLK